MRETGYKTAGGIIKKPPLIEGGFFLRITVCQDTWIPLGVKNRINCNSHPLSQIKDAIWKAPEQCPS
jgi:hypothetical protein